MLILVAASLSLPSKDNLYLNQWASTQQPISHSVAWNRASTLAYPMDQALPEALLASASSRETWRDTWVTSHPSERRCLLRSEENLSKNRQQGMAPRALDRRQLSTLFKKIRVKVSLICASPGHPLLGNLTVKRTRSLARTSSHLSAMSRFLWRVVRPLRKASS